MIMNTKILVCIVMFASFISYISVNAKHPERYYQNRHCKQLNGITEYRIHNVRVDCLTNEYAIEYDFANKFYEGISQALYYSQLTERIGKLVLIEENKEEKHFVDRAKEIIEYWNLPLELEVIDK